MKELASPSVLQRVLQRMVHAPCVFFFLDYDGTLAPIAPRPELAQPAAHARPTLESLAALRGVHVAIVTGRRVRDVQALLPVTGAHYIGAHGAEICTPEGATHLAVPLEKLDPWLARIRPILGEQLRGVPGVWIEDKEISLACHTRLAAPQDRVRARDIVRRVYEELHGADPPLEILEGHCVIELRPRGVHKGRAVLEVLRNYDAACLPIYAGDDQTDEDAFRALAGRGITIRIGACNESTCAQYCLPNPASLVTFLQEARQALSERG